MMLTFSSPFSEKEYSFTPPVVPRLTGMPNHRLVKSAALFRHKQNTIYNQKDFFFLSGELSFSTEIGQDFTWLL